MKCEPPLDTTDWTPEQKALLELLRSTSDLIMSFKTNIDYVFSYSFPWPLVHVIENAGIEARKLLPFHNLWDLTNSPAEARSIQKALGLVWDCDECKDFKQIPIGPVEEMMSIPCPACSREDSEDE